MTAHTNGKVTAGPTLADGVLVYCSNRGLVEALDLQTLETVWSFRIEDRELHAVGMGSACAYGNGTLFVGALDGNVYALDAKSGDRIWKYQTGESIDESPIVCGDFVYLNSEEKGLCAFAAKDGTVEWEEQFWEGSLRRGITGLAASESIILAGADRLYAFASDRLA